MAIIPTKKKVSNLFGFHSVRARILFWGGISLILIAGFIIGYAAVTVRDNALTSTKQEISGLADTEARIITAQLEIGLDTTRSFAHALAGAKDAEVPLNRDDVIAMLYRIVKENPQFVGMASCWEPDAFDGKDRELRPGGLFRILAEAVQVRSFLNPWSIMRRQEQETGISFPAIQRWKPLLNRISTRFRVGMCS